MMRQLSRNNEETVQVKTEVLVKLLEFAEAMLKGDYSKRVITDFSDDLITRVSNSFNRFADKMQLNPTGSDVDQDDTVNTFMDVIGSYTNLDFKQKLPISENGTIWDAIATGINMLGDELEQSTTSRQELERERNLLKEAKQQAEEANLAKSRFLANMSHEIRTPLNGILGLTQVMMTEVANPEHLKYLEMIHYSGKNLTQIINDILDFSKIESGKLELENLNFNFGKIINNEIERYRFLAKQKGLYLTCEIDNSVPQEVIGDQVRISQVVNNLISNSIKFTSQGGISVNFSTVESKEREVLIQCTISDTGIGIAKEAQTRIFQSFDQADTSVTRKYGGTGLGLSIVKNLVELMGGTISVQSPFNSIMSSGSCFTFTLRLQTPVANVDAPKVVADATSLKKPVQILVVDDNPVNLLVARKMIEKFGAVVITADNGATAIKLTQSIDFDLILMDLQMPVLDGFGAAREIRNLNYKKPIIALSASAYKEDIENSLDAGMNGHLHKPFTEAELFQVIENNI
ncbi:MAG TPA: ATP-binding protein [Cyclobacteriaceae bacterium]|nr:ATP-binding protein [Cyclobacteriaceae bacterium]